jgi:hypothetical protein
MLFRPLAARNNLRYWQVLCRLFEQLWSDGGVAPGEEIEKSKVIRVIEQHLIADDPWLDEDDQTPDSPLSTRAAAICNLLRDSGWLAERKRGLRDVMTVRPVVAQFFDMLVEFAERGPEFLGSRVQSIHVNLHTVVDGTADGGQFMEAARQAHSLWSHISNTGVQVVDVMERLQKAESTRDFVAGFFDMYVQKLFIGDYREIRTSNHPLRHRAAIVKDTVLCMEDPHRRSAILAWYVAHPGGGDAERGERVLNRDAARLMRMQDIERPLLRLDDEIRAANQQALMYLEYRTRAPSSIEKLLVRASLATARLPEEHIALPVAPPAEPMGPEWLAPVPKPSLPPEATDVSRGEPSIEALAMDALRRRMVAARSVTAAKLAMYVARHLGRGATVTSDALTVDSILDLSCYQRLLLMASRSMAPPVVVASDPFARMVAGMRIGFVEGTTINDWLEHRRFVIHREGQR